MIKTPNGQQLGPLQRIPVSREMTARAIRRLMEDLKEIQNNPLGSVVAEPLESDLFEWHCSLVGPAGSPYAGVIFHLILQFPFTYPFEPPTLFFCSYIDHPHVFGSWVCLDMLQEAQWATEEERNKPYTGWSSAYSVQSILLQLQAFLFDEAGKDQKSVEKAALSAKRFTCQTCTHAHDKPFPNIVVAKKAAATKSTLVAGQAPSNKLTKRQPRQPRVPEGYDAPGPIPVHQEEPKKVAAPAPAAAEVTPAKPVVVAEPPRAIPFYSAPQPQASVKKAVADEDSEENWTVVVSKHSRVAAAVAKKRAPASSSFSKTATQPQQQIAASASVDSNAFAALIKLRGKENVSTAADKKAATPLRVAPLTPEEQKKKLRTLKKNQKRTEKRREKRGENVPSVVIGGATLVVPSVASAPANTSPPPTPSKAVVSAPQQQQQQQVQPTKQADFTVVASKGKSAHQHDDDGEISITPPALAAKIMSELLPFALDTQLSKDFNKILCDKKLMKTLTGIDTSLFSVRFGMLVPSNPACD
jgi:ubiquitin-conjugating enzyme E2 D/E